MAQNDINDVLDHLRRIKSGVDLSSAKIDHIETLEMHLRFLRTFIHYHHIILPDFLVNITEKVKWIVEMLHWVFHRFPDECKTDLNVETLVSQFLFIEGDTSSMCNFDLNDSDLSEYIDCLGKNLNDVLMCLEFDKSDPSATNKQILQCNRVMKQVKIIQKKMRILRYVYAREINGYVDHEKLEGLRTRIQFMADNVGQFCLALFVSHEDEDYMDAVEEEDYMDSDEDEDDTNIDEDKDNMDSDEDEDNMDSDEDEDDTSIDVDEDDISSKPPYLLCLIVLVELEMKKIFLSQSRAFKEKKLPKGFSHHLHSLLMYLRNKKLKNFPNNVSARNTDVAIEFLLIFLNADLSNHVINGNWLNEVMEKVGAIAGDVLYVIQKLLPSSINKDDTSKIRLCSIQILEKTKDLKAQVETYYKSLKFTPSQFPTFSGLSFLDSLLRKLNEMSKSKSGLDFLKKPLFGNLEKEISSLTSNLEKELSSIFADFTKVHHEHKILKDLQRRTINLAYEAEVAIDSIRAQYNTFWHIFCTLPTILKEIKHISEELTKMWSENLSLKSCYVVEPSKHLSTRHSSLVNDEEIVGFENEAEELIDYLTQGTRELDVIPIVGMGGQGKTTCARKLYYNDIIVSRFDVRAWCIISQIYNRRDLLQEIFGQVTGSKDKGDTDDILADEVRKSLMGKRYLIVLDDMWDGAAWDDLRLSFPDVGNRSRIVVTTRLEKVGEHVMHHIDPYYLPFLTTEESCKLLQKKVFQKEDCPSELQDASQAVAEKCKGLPLVVVLVAGIIKKRKMEESWWNEVKYALFDYFDRESEEYSRATMQLSYDNLPECLKPCLLYMGMFPEDARIPVSKLISLWIAEGFVQNIESAEDYLMDLISSNVVMVSKREYNGNVKYCQIHDVVLYFCLEKSREEKFMLAVKGQFQHSDLKESRLRFSFSNELSKFAALGSKLRKPFHQCLRSLITTNEGELSNWNPFHQVSDLRLLKVRDLNSCCVRALRLDTLNPLIHLKYLAVATYKFHFHPESHLPHLETLIVYDVDYSVLPAAFWKMEKLRHVDIWAEFDFENNKQGIFDESSKLENLRILRNVVFPIDEADRVDLLLRRCPNLQELHISFKDIKYSADTSPFCLKLESLTQLQILRLSFAYLIFRYELQFPSNLKKLVLFTTPIERAIPFIAGLPNLEYLQLRNLTISKEWCLPKDITFHKLKFLKLVRLGISRWDASEESFPLLETVVIKGCYKLKEIPLSFADIPTLKQIKLMYCKRSLTDSAEKIKKEVEENEGCDRINVITI